ncbi:MAG TPA: hypothetical protein VEY71_05375 [Chitinophagales bacterium]|nr:hypothetical protein [Chitinophagales bacterium]
MSHHGLEHFQNLNPKKESLIDSFNKTLSPPPKLSDLLGATGRYPNGKINAQDEGEIGIGCALYEGKLIINFGDKPISWIGMTKDEAKAFAEYILEKIKPL